MQQCSSYRPHYHEPFVHYSASYLNENFMSRVRRVVFVGGGDSMLLHEVLKYPDVEVVLGLELDQKVTRDSFEHFKTQPHFDNPKVQWWFGDGARSLTMLPREYFGTFDLVLLDLSETVMSMTVTKGLDVFSAMKLLLGPNGVLVKNDFGYFEKLAKVFDTCLQLLVWAPVTDYSKYWGEPRECAGGGHDDDANVETAAHAGVLMIVEAENVSAEVGDAKWVAAALKGSLKSLGYGVLSVHTAPSARSGGASIVLSMEEGYVLVETWPDAKYCKLDIHLWGGFEGQEGVRSGLLEVLGSAAGDWQSYRIVTGGMRGARTRATDLKTVGPDLTQIGKCAPVEEGSTKSITHNSSYNDREALQPVIDAGLDDIVTMMVGTTGLNAVVFCGGEGAPCPARDNLGRQGFAVLVTLWQCSPEEEELMDSGAEQCGRALQRWREAMTTDAAEFSLCGKKADVALKEVSRKMGGINLVVADVATAGVHVMGAYEYWLKHCCRPLPRGGEG